jgi:hypothetical protein
MLLEDAESKEQVERALAEGDDELSDDIDDQLKHAQDAWERKSGSYCEYDEIDYPDYIKTDHFAAEVVDESPAEYDLSQIPIAAVKAELEALADVGHGKSTARRSHDTWGPFSTDDRGENAFTYTITPNVSCWFPEDLMPVNAEFIPEPIIEAFWKSFSVEWDSSTSVADNVGWQEGYDHVYITSKYDAFHEWCRDLLAAYFMKEMREDPTAGLARFFAALPPAEAAFLKQANLPQDELLDLAGSFLGGVGANADDTRERIHEYVEAFKSPDTPVREILGTWTQTDLVAMGIIKGTLFEEAPWQLVKLLPFDLRLEGTMMSHCVGDSGMGYISAVRSGQIEIWSLRARAGKPRFTLEVEQYTEDGARRAAAHLGETLADFRSHTIKQIKGKGNRLPGFTDSRLTTFKFPEEVIFWHRVFLNLGVNPYGVVDLKPGLQKLEGFPRRALQANPSLSFNAPYTPLAGTSRDPYRYW